VCRANRRREGVLLLWALMQLHVRVYRKTERHFESKELLGKVCVLRHGIYLLHYSFMINFFMRNGLCSLHGLRRKAVWMCKMANTLVSHRKTVELLLLLSTHENSFDLGSGCACVEGSRHMFVKSNGCIPVTNTLG
jgi:hypothetical protein